VAAGPRLWNSLPADLRQADISFEQFKRLQKTFLFGCWDRGTLWLTVNLRLISSLTYLLTYIGGSEHHPLIFKKKLFIFWRNLSNFFFWPKWPSTRARTVTMPLHDSMLPACMLTPCLCHRTDAFLKPEGKAAYTAVIALLTHYESMVAACCPQSGTLSSFSALTMLVGPPEALPACKSSATKVYVWALAYPIVSYHRKVGQLNENGVCVCCVYIL